jgi:type III secretion protein Q
MTATPAPRAAPPREMRPAPARLSRTEAEASRRLFLARAPLVLAIGDHRLSLELASSRALATADPGTARLVLRGLDGPALLGLPRALVRLLLGTLGPSVPETHPDLDLLIETVLAPHLSSLEQLLGHPLSLHPAAETLPPELRLIGFHLALDDRPLGLATLRLSGAAAGALTAALDRLPPQRNRLDALPVGVTIEVGSVRLTLGLLRSIGRGDVLLSDDSYPPGTAVLTLGGRFHLPGVRTETGLQITADTHRWDPIAMDDAHTDTAETIDNLEVRVVFEVGRRDLPLAELQRIRPGYVLELDRAAGLSVDLAVRGQIIGKGELVQVEDALGVRVLRLFGHE